MENTSPPSTPQPCGPCPGAGVSPGLQTVMAGGSCARFSFLGQCDRLRCCLLLSSFSSWGLGRGGGAKSGLSPVPQKFNRQLRCGQPLPVPCQGARLSRGASMGAVGKGRRGELLAGEEPKMSPMGSVEE